jgi:hypothetical protein
VLVLFLGWVVVLAVAVTVGTGLLVALGVALDDLGDLGDVAISGAWAGLGLLGALLLLASVVLPVGPALVVVVAVVLVAGALTLAPVRSCWGRLVRAGPTALVVAGGLLLVGAALFTRPVTWFDTGAYHLGIIDWLARFGSVPGVALLHIRLGFGSGWFALGAAFDHGFLRGHGVGLLGGLAVLLGVAHALVIGARVLQRRADGADLFGLAALVAVLVSLPSDLMISPSPDLAVDFLTVEAAILVFRACGRVAAARRWTLLTGAVVLAGAAGTMKLTALPFTLMVIVFALLLRAPARRLLVYVGIAALFVVPLLVSNTVTSGCPLLPAGPCLDADFAISNVERSATQDDMLEFIRGESRNADRGTFDWLWREWVTSGEVPRSTIAIGVVVAGAFAAAWLLLRNRRWWSPALFVSAAALAATAILSRRLPNVLFLVALLAGVLVVWKARAPGPRVVALMGLAGCGFLMVASPLLRYALGYAALCLGAGLVVVLDRLGAPGPATTPRGPPVRVTRRGRIAIGAGALVLALVAAVTVPGFGRGLAGARDLGALVLPPDVPDAVVTRERTRDFAYLASLRTKQCWLAPLPCTEDVLPADRRLRDEDEGIGGGFVRR